MVRDQSFHPPHVQEVERRKFGERRPVPVHFPSSRSWTMSSFGSSADPAVLCCQGKCNGDRLILPSLDHHSSQDTPLLQVLSIAQGRHHPRNWRQSRSTASSTPSGCPSQAAHLGLQPEHWNVRSGFIGVLNHNECHSFSF